MLGPCPFPPPPAWAHDLTAIGVTGTNGKTTTCAFLAAALRASGAPVLRVTTVGSFLDDERLDVPEDHEGFLRALELCRDAGGKHAVLEVTSEALAVGFARAWPMRIGVFTNLTRDHLDAHGSAEHYLASKAQLFVHLPSGGTAVLPANDPAGALLEEILPAGVTCLHWGRGSTERPAEVELIESDASWTGTRMLVGIRGRERTLSLRAVGAVYAENAAAALGGAIAAGVDIDAAAARIAREPAPEGRFQVVASRPWVVVDYAHTPDALEQTLRTARSLCEGRLTLVFGAGGHRDRGKRPQMGRIATSADSVILTTDNPRNEDPVAIAAQVRSGMTGYPGVVEEPDRREAIRRAISEANDADVIVIAGKGHERTQRVGARSDPFSDVEEAERVLRSVDRAFR